MPGYCVPSVHFFANPIVLLKYALMILLGLLLQISLNIVIFKKTGPSVALKIIQRDVIAKYNEPDFLYDREAIERLQQEVGNTLYDDHRDPEVPYDDQEDSTS